MTLHTVTRFLVDRSDLASSRIDTYELDEDSLKDGEVLLRVTSFGLSANNITYAALGEKMGYWGFFPGTNHEGIIPVWGFAEVVASQHPDLQTGELLYGYLPFASHLIIQPDKVTAYTLSDSHPARNSIHPGYDQYTRCAADPAYRSDNEAWQMNFRPLFMTSFVLDEAVSTFKSHNIVVTSASSKTALGAAFLLSHHRSSRQANYRITGLTSPNNMAFTTSFDCYDDVLSYEDIGQLPTSTPLIVLDFAGNGEALSRIATHCGSAFEKLWMIGATDWDAASGHRPKDVDASLFFAPEYVTQLQQQWGGKAFMQRYAEAWSAFYQQLSAHFIVHPVTGGPAMQQVYLELLNGNISPSQVNVLQW